MRGLSKVVSKIMRKFGVELIRVPIEKTVDEYGNVEVKYKDPAVFIGHLTQITGLDRVFERFGVLVEADYILTTKPEIQLNLGDIVRYKDSELEVMEKIYRNTGRHIDFMEYLLRRRK